MNARFGFFCPNNVGYKKSLDSKRLHHFSPQESLIRNMKVLVVLSVLALGASAYNTGRSHNGGNAGFETVYDSQRDGENHPYVTYDSKRDGADSQKQFMYNNDASLTTVYDSQKDGLNHPYVVSDTRRDNARAVNTNAVRMPQQQQQHQQQQQYQPQMQQRVQKYQPQMQQRVQHNQRQMTYQQPAMMMAQHHNQGQVQQPQRNTYNAADYANYEVVYDSKRDGLDHPYVVYDSKRDGLSSPLRSLYDNDPSLETIFDTKVHGWNHPWVIYDSKRDAGVRNF